jgi:hypothetical protein
MRQSTATTATRDAADHADRDREPSRTWAVLGALAHAGAFIDPSGVLASQRFRRPREDQHVGQ